jgi:hypothetical protein
MKYPRFRPDEKLWVPPRQLNRTTWVSTIDGEPVPGRLLNEGEWLPEDYADLIGVRAFAKIAGIADQSARQHRKTILPPPYLLVDMGAKLFPVWNRDTAHRYKKLID